MVLHESYLTITLGYSLRNQVEASKCSLFIQSARGSQFQKNLFTIEILNTVYHTNTIQNHECIVVSLSTTRSDEHCRNVQIIINSMYTIKYYWNKLFWDTIPFFHYIWFGKVHLTGSSAIPVDMRLYSCVKTIIPLDCCPLILL
jgi:hypothetical protein